MSRFLHYLYYYTYFASYRLRLRICLCCVGLGVAAMFATSYQCLHVASSAEYIQRLTQQQTNLATYFGPFWSPSPFLPILLPKPSGSYQTRPQHRPLFNPAIHNWSREIFIVSGNHSLWRRQFKAACSLKLLLTPENRPSSPSGTLRCGRFLSISPAQAANARVFIALNVLG